MQNVIKAQVIGAKRYDIDGNKMASIFVMQKAEETDDSVGFEVMKMSAPYDVVEHLKGKKLPGDYDVLVRMRAAGGGKMALIAEGIKAISPITGGAKSQG